MLSLKYSSSELRRFGFLVGGIFCALALYFFLRNKGYYLPVAVIGSALVLSGVFVPKILAPVFGLWMLLGHILGWVNSRLILGIVFFFLLTPMALFMRLIGRDALARRFDKELATYWEERQQEFSAEGLKNQF